MLLALALDSVFRVVSVCVVPSVVTELSESPKSPITISKGDLRGLFKSFL